MKKGAKVWCFIVILVFLFAIPSLCFVVMAGGVGVDDCLFGDQNIGKLEDLHSNSYQPKGANNKIITSLSTFEKGDKILNSKGDKGMILESYGINWWFIRWEKESSEGRWSEENQLRKNDFNPSTKFSSGNPVEVCGTKGLGLDVRTEPPDLAWKGGIREGAKGTIIGGPFYGIPKDHVSENEKILYHFWKVKFESITGWCAEGYPGGVDYLKLVIHQPPNTPIMLFQLKSDGVTPIPVGSETTENSVTFKGVVSDPDGDRVKLQVELRRLDEYGGQFDETQGGFKESGFLESGSEAVASANDLIDADYHWRARAVDEHGNEGEWEDFGNNFNSEIDFRVSWGVIKYAPTLKFDGNDERYFPCDIHGDDDNVINNHENYDASDLPKTTDDGKHVCYYYVKEYTEQSGIYPEHPDYYVYEYWYYYAFNEYDICVINDLLCIIEDYHEHDLESVFIWVDKKTGNPFHLALSCHLWFNEYEIHSVDELAIYVEKGGHGMSKGSKNNVPFVYNKAFYAGLTSPGDPPDEGIEVSFKSDGEGEVLKGNENFDFRPLDSLIQYEDRDLVKDEGSIYYNQFKSGCTKPGYDDDCPFEYGEDKTPWYRCDNPEEEVSMIRGQTILRIISGIIPLKFLHALQLPLNSPELRIYDSQGNVTGLVGGEVKEEIPNSIYNEESKTIIIFSSTDLNSYRYKIVGTDEETYVFRVTSVEGGEFTNFTATDIPTTPGAIHQYTIDWAALSQGEKGVTVKIDSNGNGTFERPIITNNSFQPLIAEFTVSPENPLIGEKVTLDASTSFDLGGGVIKKYRWEFYNAANQDPFYVIEGHDKEIIRYTFTSEGIYLVRLTVTDDDGEYSYTESSITIKESIKEPVFYVPDDYPSIQAAVDAANAGDTIIVRDGTYTENVAVNKRLTIQSENGYKNCIVKAAKSNEDVFTVTVDYVNISGFTVKGALTEWDYTSYGGSAGIYLDHVNYCNISNNNALNNHNGIHLRDSSHICITNNNVQLNKNDGIFLSTSSNNIIDNNKASLITLWWSSNNNVLTNNNATISLYFASNNILTNNKGSEINLRSYSNNNIANNNIIGAGISLDSCSNNSILTNTLEDKGISIYGRNLSHFNTHIIKDNVINGKPIYYYKNIKGIKVTETGGQIIIANCSNIIVENISNGRIDLAYTNDSKISNNNVSKIEVRYSSNDTIANNNVRNGDGINIGYSSNNKIISNNVSNNSYGIFIGISSNNIIVNNMVNSNINDGISLDGSPDNVIYFNNFVGNGRNVCAYGLNNIWNSPAPITYTYNGNTYTNYLGNYWDDYTDVDTDNDGIWDNPYSITWDIPYSINSDQDYYPLMTWSEHYFIYPPHPIPTLPTPPPTSTLTPTPRPTLTLVPRPTLTLAPRPTLTLAPRPTLTPTPRPTLRPTATLFEKIEGLIAAIRVGAGI